MAINLNDFISILKREGQWGTPQVLSDQNTADILASVNKRGARIWSAADWKWQREKLAFAVTPGTSQYSVIASSGNAIDRILDIIPNDPTVSPPISASPLQEMELGEFYQKCPQSNIIPDIPTKYVNIGQNSSNVWQIIIWPSPASAFTMSGFAKAVPIFYTQSDVTANNPIKYFPNGVVLDALFAGCMIDIALLKGMPMADSIGLEAQFEAKIKKLIGEQIGVATDNSPKTCPMPDRISNRMANRRNRNRGTQVF